MLKSIMCARSKEKTFKQSPLKVPILTLQPRKEIHSVSMSIKEKDKQIQLVSGGWTFLTFVVI